MNDMRVSNWRQNIRFWTIPLKEPWEENLESLKKLLRKIPWMLKFLHGTINANKKPSAQGWWIQLQL